MLNILTRLHSLTGSLKPAPGSKLDELLLLQRSLLEQLAVNPDLAVFGNRTRQEFTQPAASAEPSSHLSRLLDQLTAQAATKAPTVTPLVFRRETLFHSSLLGNSVPSWGSGLAPTQTYGPFLDEHGLQIWFDFFFPTRTVQVFQQGGATPIILLPIRGPLTGGNPFTSKPAAHGSLPASSPRPLRWPAIIPASKFAAAHSTSLSSPPSPPDTLSSRLWPR
jgi:hypothetical protein